MAARLLHPLDELFTSLDRSRDDWNNHDAERMVRPAVILRKSSQCNRSDRGAATQAVLMTIHRTLTLRGLDPKAAIADALTADTATGTLPPMPSGVERGGRVTPGHTVGRRRIAAQSTQTDPDRSHWHPARPDGRSTSDRIHDF